MVSLRRSQDSSITPKRRSRAGSLFEDPVSDTRSSLQRSSIAFLEWHKGTSSDSGRQRASFGDASMAPSDLRRGGASSSAASLRRGYQKSVSQDLQMEEEVRTLSEQNYRIEEECRELANQVRELKTECDMLELSLEESRREKQNLEETQEPGRHSFHELASEADSLRASEQEALEELNVLQGRIDQAKQESSAKLWKSMFTEEQAKKKSAKLEQKVVSLQDELGGAKEEKQKRLEEALVLREELKDAKEALNVEKDKARLARFPSDASPPGMNVAGTGESLFDQLNVARNPDLIEEVEELQEQLERCERQGETLHLSAQEEMAKAAALRTELKQQNQAFEELEAWQERQGNEAAGRIAELSDRLNQETEASDSWRQEHATTKTSQQKLLQEHQDAEAKQEEEVASLRAAYLHTEQSLNEKVSESEAWEAAMEEKTAHAALLQTELERLQEEKRQCVSALSQLELESSQERELQEMQQAKQEAQQEALKAELQDKSQQAQELQKAFKAELQDQSSQALRLQQALKAELQAADQKNASSAADHEHRLSLHKDELSKWEAKEASSTQTIADLQASLATASERHRSLAALEQERSSEVEAWSQSWCRLNERHKEVRHLEEHQRSQSEHLAQSLRAGHEELSQLETSLQKAARRNHDLDSQLLEQRSCTLRYEKDEKILEERAATLAVNVRQAIADLRSRKESQESTQRALDNEEMRCKELEVAFSSVQVQLGCAQQDSVDKDYRLKTEGSQIKSLQSELDWYVNEAQMHQRLRDETLGAELAAMKLDRLQDELFPHNRAVLSSLATESAEEAAQTRALIEAKGTSPSTDALEHIQRQRLFLSMLSEGFGSTAKRTSSPLSSASMGHVGMPPQTSGQHLHEDPTNAPLRRLVAAPCGSMVPDSPRVLLSPPQKARDTRVPGTIVLPPPSMQEVQQAPPPSPLQRLARPVC
mmetsp:Transcript_55114/g.129015  ORF Transcript_55114/g.129015 Transcript_55114/m.129015 type:complete len:946 (+) Transcript_55114:119-2956(+)